jgi:hypothetical protein
MDIKTEQIIAEKVKVLEIGTGDKVSIEKEVGLPFGAFIDWPNWNNVGLPRILIKPEISSDSVHVLHELIHLEIFFIFHYPIVGCLDRKLHRITHVFKNIPEDYVAHKIIREDYGLDPIGEGCINDDKNLGGSDKELARNLTQYYLFSEFHQGYKKRFPKFLIKCKRQRHSAFFIAEKAIDCIMAIDHKNKEDYIEGVKKLINIFEPNLYKQGAIRLYCFSKDQEQWKWNPLD